ncbi:MAG: aminotransferase class IV [Candidatus Planktophila sp.]|nr:aminotransferase class IV [Candidatus Planktophila sp.]
MKISFNGALLDIETTPCTPTGWLQGNGLFESLRTVNGVVYAYSRHIARAIKSAQIAQINLPDLELVEQAVEAVLEAEPHPDGLLRISFGSNDQWAVVHLPYHSHNKPARVRIHPDALAPDSQMIKSYPYGHRLAILEEAKLVGFDDALVCNTDGNICEGAVSNVMMSIDGRWVTPPTSDGTLPGIMRELVVEHFGVSIESISLSRIDEIRGAILLSSLRISQPVASIDGRELEASQSFSDKIRAMVTLHSLG